MLTIFDPASKSGRVVGKASVCYGLCKTTTGKDMCTLGHTSELVSEVGSVVVGSLVSPIGLTLILVAVHSMCIPCVEVGTATLVLYNLPHDNGTKPPLTDGIKSLDVAEEVTEVETEKETSRADLVESGKVSCTADVVGCHTEPRKVMPLNESSSSESKTAADRVNGVIHYTVLNASCESGVNATVTGRELNGANTNVEAGVIDACVS